MSYLAFFCFVFVKCELCQAMSYDIKDLKYTNSFVYVSRCIVHMPESSIYHQELLFLVIVTFGRLGVLKNVTSLLYWCNNITGRYSLMGCYSSASGYEFSTSI